MASYALQFCKHLNITKISHLKTLTRIYRCFYYILFVLQRLIVSAYLFNQQMEMINWCISIPHYYKPNLIFKLTVRKFYLFMWLTWIAMYSKVLKKINCFHYWLEEICFFICFSQLNKEPPRFRDSVKTILAEKQALSHLRIMLLTGISLFYVIPLYDDFQHRKQLPSSSKMRWKCTSLKAKQTLHL